MAQSYTQEQIDEIVEKLPEELQEAIFSVETTNAVWNAYEAQDIVDGKIRKKISQYVGWVLMGLVLPSEFQGILEKEVKLPKNIAKEIARDINRFVFYPVRPALEQLHRMEIEVSAKIVTPEPSLGEVEQPKTEERPSGPDTYRESIE